MQSVLAYLEQSPVTSVPCATQVGAVLLAFNTIYTRSTFQSICAQEGVDNFLCTTWVVNSHHAFYTTTNLFCNMPSADSHAVLLVSMLAFPNVRTTCLVPLHSTARLPMQVPPHKGLRQHRLQEQLPQQAGRLA
jgi:hypothetical protein